MKDNQERQDESDFVDEYLTEPPKYFNEGRGGRQVEEKALRMTIHGKVEAIEQNGMIQKITEVTLMDVSSTFPTLTEDEEKALEANAALMHRRDRGELAGEGTSVFARNMAQFGKSLSEAAQELTDLASKRPAPTPNMIPPKKMQGQKPQVVIIDEVKAPPKPEPKKPFVRKEHLTDRPFKNHEGLQALQEKQQADAKRAREARNKFKRRGAKSINPPAKRQR